MPLFTIISNTSDTNEYSNRPLYDIRESQCSMHRPGFTNLNYLEDNFTPFLYSLYAVLQHAFTLNHQ